MSIYMLQGALEEGLIYAFVALGLYVSYQILNIADMTTDGSFVLGSAVSSVLVIAGHPILALLAALIAGAASGFITAFLQTKLGVPSILAGIITMTGLYSINLLVQGGSPELFYKQDATIFTMADNIIPEEYSVIVTLGIITILFIVAIAYFFTTQVGLSIRATGDNIDMVQSSSINPSFTITLGLMLSNGLIAFAGALLAQRETKGNINSGVGIVVIGLASLVIGGLISRRSNKVLIGVIGGVVGAIIYRIIFTVAIRYTPDPGYLKIVSAFIVAVVIAYPKIKEGIAAKRKQKRRESLA